MSEKDEIYKYLEELVGEEGVSMPCEKADIFRDEEGWKL